MGLKVTNGELNKQVMLGAFDFFINADLNIDEYGWDARMLYKEFVDGTKPYLDEREKIKTMHQKKGKDGNFVYLDNRSACWKSAKDKEKAEEKLKVLSEQKVTFGTDAIILALEEIPYYLDKDGKEQRVPLGTMIACEPFIILTRDKNEKKKIVDERNKTANRGK